MGEVTTGYIIVDCSVFLRLCFASTIKICYSTEVCDQEELFSQVSMERTMFNVEILRPNLYFNKI